MSEAIKNPAAPVENSGLQLIEGTDVNKMAEQLQAIANFQAMVEKNLSSGQDYGVIPGTQKPTLLKPGAEKIQMLMGVTSEYEVLNKVEDYDKGFFTYTVRATLSKNGTKITEGLGSANTKEKRYRNQDPFMIVNTVLKMAKKRAQVDATLTIASLSNVFTQDIEDMDQLNQKEQMENMTPADAKAMKITFGKYRGKTLGEIYKENGGYLNWLAENAKEDAMKQAAMMVLNPPATPQQTTPSEPNPEDKPTRSSTVETKLKLIGIQSKQLQKLMSLETEHEAADNALAQVVPDYNGDVNSLTDDQITQVSDVLQQMINVSQTEAK